MDEAGTAARYHPSIVQQLRSNSDASERDVDRALRDAVLWVRGLPRSAAHFDQLVLSRARLYLYKKALNGVWPSIDDYKLFRFH